MLARRIALIGAWLLLAACTPGTQPAAATPTAEDEVASAAGAPAANADGPETPAPAPANGKQRCDPVQAQSVLGQRATPAIVAQAQADSQAGAVRVLAPGTPVTEDFSEARLNLEVDATNTITGASCG